MPIYEYVCDNCGHQFEHLLRGGQWPFCPSCGAKRLSKQFSVPAAHTTGSSEPACPVREAGACDVSSCRRDSCNLTNLM